MTPEQQAAQIRARLPAGSFADRLAATGPDEQQMHRSVMTALVAGSPSMSQKDAAQTAGMEQARAAAALQALAAAELIALDTAGTVVGAFPISAVPTRHHVQLGTGTRLYAMCAVDALGIPVMLERTGVISSTDPDSGKQITVTVQAGVVHVDPPETVVLLAGNPKAGSIAQNCCPIIDFYADPRAAQAAVEAPGVTGSVVSLADAYALGAALFADLLLWYQPTQVSPGPALAPKGRRPSDATPQEHATAPKCGPGGWDCQH